MGAATKERVDALLDEAEREGRCCVPTEQRDRKALLYRGLEMVEPLHGLFVRRGVWKGLNPAERTLWLMRGLARLHPTWRFCGPSAAVALGLPVTWGLLSHVFCDAPAGSRQRVVPGVWCRRISDSETCGAGGVRVTSLWRTVFDCLVSMPAADALAVLDRAMALSGSSARQVVEYLRTVHRGRRGVARAAELALLGDGRAESGGESIARHTMHGLGYATPELQVWIEDPVEPGKWFRVDFLWMLPDGTIVIGELDGRQKTERPELMSGRSAVRVLQDERLRESHLTALRPKILRFDYETARDPSALGALLERFGVPLRTQEPTLPRATRTVRSELMFLGGWMVLATEEVAA